LGIVLTAASAVVPPNNESTLLKSELGKRLFFDPILSSDSSVSCASCHQPERAFADGVALSKGVQGKTGTRNTPSAMNLSSRSAFFHDGRAKTLAEQAAGPIENPVEMNLSLTEAVKRLRATQYYQAAFRAAFRKNPNREHLLEALAAYVSTLETGSSPWDAFAKGDEHAVSESAKRGRELFTGKAQCFDCHSGIDFTNDEFRNIGLYDGSIWNDEGRGAVTKLDRDKGRFKVPGLRNVALTAPYMHNGGLPNLRAVLDHYNDPNRLVPQAIGRDSLVHPLGLTEGEIDDLEAFLNCLTDTTLLNGAKKWKPSASIDIFAPNNHNHGKR
jgi:cytochrome c peroxidase